MTITPEIAREIIDLTQRYGQLNSNVAWLEKVLKAEDVTAMALSIRYKTNAYRYEDFSIPGDQINARAMVKAYSRRIEQKRTAIVLRLNQLGVQL